ncbi:MAG: hypothetical protein M9918_14435 [Anaerolineae bacterium]|nr:hypothetical protein [Anaerolineae bacterium]
MNNLAALPIQQLRTLAALNALTTPEQPCSVSDVTRLTGYTAVWQYEILDAMQRKNMTQCDIVGYWNITPEYAVAFVRGVLGDE